MHKTYTILFFFFCTLGVFAQGDFQLQSKLVDHNRAFDRNGFNGFNEDWAPFYHGVASGDPLEDRVIIWTRVTPDPLNSDPIEVAWRIASDPELTDVVASGTFTTDMDRDYTVKVDVEGLSAGTTYYYGFTAMGKNSLTGRTKTVPVGNSVDHLKFGVVSCSNFQAGYFNAYRRLAERNDLDAIIHLGDYIYEYEDGYYGDSALFEKRPLEPQEEIVAIDQYRARYSTYRLDTALVRAHQQHPFITIWDDHESANDAYLDGAENHDPDTEGDWGTRKDISKQVYFEWLPIRDNAEENVYRTIQYGDLMDLIMLDTRLEGREKQVDSITDPELFNPNRTLLGQEQYDWFIDELGQSDAQWKVIGQQVIFSELNVGWFALFDPSGQTTFEDSEGLFVDIWDGYPAERSKIINYIDQNEIDNVVILTGDFHSTFAYDVTEFPVDLQVIPSPNGPIPVYFPSPTYNPATGEGSVAVEFATPSITSANFDENLDPFTAALIQQLINNEIVIDTMGTSLGNPNPHMKYTDLLQHGYYILDVKPDSAQANWYFGPINEVVEEESFASGWYTLEGENHLQASAKESAPKTVQDIPAPLNPPMTTSVVEAENKDLVLLSTFPNPFSGYNTLHYGVNQTGPVRISLLNASGQLVKVLFEGELNKGVYSLTTTSIGLENGVYYYQIECNGELKTKKIILSK
jgi:alkaline phosphatase D